jgi:hypothetical protein
MSCQLQGMRELSGREYVRSGAFQSLSQIERDQGFILDDKNCLAREWWILHLDTPPVCALCSRLFVANKKGDTALLVNPTMLQCKMIRWDRYLASASFATDCPLRR